MKRGYKRIAEPMIRVNGTLQTATWEDALAKVAAGFSIAALLLTPPATAPGPGHAAPLTLRTTTIRVRGPPVLAPTIS